MLDTPVKPRPVTREAHARHLRYRRATIEGVGRLIARTLNRRRPRLSQVVIQVTHSVTTLMVWSVTHRRRRDRRMSWNVVLRANYLA